MPAHQPCAPPKRQARPACLRLVTCVRRPASGTAPAPASRRSRTQAPMRQRSVPPTTPRTWAALAAASVLGTNLGDLVSHTLHLGHLRGLPVLALASPSCWPRNAAPPAPARPATGSRSSSCAPPPPTSPTWPPTTPACPRPPSSPPSPPSSAPCCAARPRRPQRPPRRPRPPRARDRPPLLGRHADRRHPRHRRRRPPPGHGRAGARRSPPARPCSWPPSWPTARSPAPACPPTGQRSSWRDRRHRRGRLRGRPGRPRPRPAAGDRVQRRPPALRPAAGRTRPGRRSSKSFFF